MPNNLIVGPDTLNKYHINLVSESILPILSGHSLVEQARICSTAITIGTVTLTKVGNNQYTIDQDTYNFEMHDWDTSAKRNWLTILGHMVSEGICVELDATIAKLIGVYAARSFTISAGLLNRHVYGTTEFEIIFDGILTTR